MSSEGQKTLGAVDNQEGEPLVSREANRNRAWVAHAVREIQSRRDVEPHLELLFKEYEPLCRSLIASFDIQIDVDDLVQEVFWRVYRGMDSFRLDSSFETWLVHIVKNVVRNAIRNRETEKAKVVTAAASLDALKPDEDDSPAMQEPISPNPNPLDSLLNKEREAELEALLLELPPRTRQSMLFYYVHGYQQSEIAKLQGTSVNTVKKQLVNGRKRLRPLFSVFMELSGLLLLVLFMVG